MDGNLWKECGIPGESPCKWSFGPLDVWIKVISGELWLAYQHKKDDSTAEPAGNDPLEDLAWTRWALRDKYTKIRFTPVFPDKPIVIKPEYPFLLTRKANARVYVRCPVWVNVSLINDEKLKITEIPTVVLSETWFGDFLEGTLCYWLSTSARRTINSDLLKDYLAVCPLDITNESHDELVVEKLCLRVSGLSIFSFNGRLWSDEIKVDYQGKDSISRITVSGKAPSEVSGAELLSPPREEARKSFAARTFASLMDLPGMGGITN